MYEILKKHVYNLPGTGKSQEMGFRVIRREWYGNSQETIYVIEKKIKCQGDKQYRVE